MQRAIDEVISPAAQGMTGTLGEYAPPVVGGFNFDRQYLGMNARGALTGLEQNPMALFNKAMDRAAAEGYEPGSEEYFESIAYAFAENLVHESTHQLELHERGDAALDLVFRRALDDLNSRLGEEGLAKIAAIYDEALTDDAHQSLLNLAGEWRRRGLNDRAASSEAAAGGQPNPAPEDPNRPRLGRGPEVLRPGDREAAPPADTGLGREPGGELRPVGGAVEEARRSGELPVSELPRSDEDVARYGQTRLIRPDEPLYHGTQVPDEQWDASTGEVVRPSKNGMLGPGVYVAHGGPGAVRDAAAYAGLQDFAPQPHGRIFPLKASRTIESLITEEPLTPDELSRIRSAVPEEVRDDFERRLADRLKHQDIGGAMPQGWNVMVL